MKISKKQKEKFITSFDKHLFIVRVHDNKTKAVVSEEILVLDDKEDLKNVIVFYDKNTDNKTTTAYPEYFDTSALLTADDIENEDVFAEKIARFCNPTGNIHAVFIDDGSYTHKLFYSRSSFLAGLKEHEKVFAFAADSYVYIPEANNHSQKLANIADDTVVCVYNNPGAYGLNYSLAVWAEAEFCKYLFDSQLSDRISSAVNNNRVFKHGYDVPAEDLLTLAPWEITQKYPGLAIMPSVPYHTANAVTIAYQDFLQCNYLDYNFSALNAYRKKIAQTKTALAWFASCTAIKERENVIAKYSPKDKFAIVEKSDHAITYDTSVTITDYASACNALENAGLFPITGHFVFTNGLECKFNECKKSYIDRWTTIVYDAKNHVNLVFKTQVCPLSFIEIVSSQGYDVSLFCNAIPFKILEKEYDILAFSDILNACYCALTHYTSVDEFKDFHIIVHKITTMLCLFTSFGFMKDAIISGAFTVKLIDDYLYSPQVAELVSQAKPSAVWHTDELESKLAVMANTMYRLLFKDTMLEYTVYDRTLLKDVTKINKNSVFDFIDSKLGYIRLMYNSTETVPVESIFIPRNVYLITYDTDKLEI